MEPPCEGPARGAALVRLYRAAADHDGTDEARAFFLTHAYVHALEAGLPEAAGLYAALRAMGRED